VVYVSANQKAVSLNVHRYTAGVHDAKGAAGEVGRFKLNSVYPSIDGSLKATGSLGTLGPVKLSSSEKLISQSLLSKCNQHRYSEGCIGETAATVTAGVLMTALKQNTGDVGALEGAMVRRRGLYRTLFSFFSRHEKLYIHETTV
jgi:hypothetical protein